MTLMHSNWSQLVVGAFGATVLATALGAQSTLPPVRPIGPVTRVSAADQLGSVSQVRPLPGGRLLVNDIQRRQLVLLDSTFANIATVADTTAATASAYGGRAGGLIPYRGDSSLFIDPASLSMLVVDAAGTVARVMAVPRPNDAQFMVGGPFGTPAFDVRGRIVYRGVSLPRPPAQLPAPGGAPFLPELPDSAPVLRVDLATRTLDTAAFFRIPATRASVTQNDKGQMNIAMVMNPMSVVDDWTVLPDGSVAVIRGADYHIDWIAPDGSKRSSPKIPFDWQRLSDEQKVAFIDSARTAAEASRARMMASTTTAGPAPGGAVVSSGGPPPSGGGEMRFEFSMGGPGGPGGGPTTPIRVAPPAITMVKPSELPDYRPAFGTGATKVDADGNLWIRTSKIVDRSPVYDVVNREGRLVDRVVLPFGRVIAGFGAGVVYMGVRDDKGARLEIARLR
jgi:hypothetical protein